MIKHDDTALDYVVCMYSKKSSDFTILAPYDQALSKNNNNTIEKFEYTPQSMT